MSSRRTRGRRCCRTRRSAVSAIRKTWRRLYAFSAPTRPPSSQARSSSSKVGWGCEWTCWKPERGLSRGRAWPGADKEGLDIAGSEGGGSRGNHGFPRAENGRARIVITGMGALTPLGNDFESSWSNLIAGQSGAAPITHFDAGEYSVHFACELKEFDPTEWIDRKQARRMDRFAQMIVAAARQAEADSGLDIAKESDRIGASVATGIGGLQAYQDCYDTLRERGPTRVNPFSIPAIIPNMGAAWVSMQLGTKGPLMSQCTACAAGNMAIGESIDAIRLGRADVMLCGGTEAPVTEIGIAGFSAMRALSRRNAAPEKASRPFDAGRDGFVMGEAGAILVIEELEHARARGTSTPLGDASETRVIKLAVGEERAREIPISSTKGATGHTLGASGAVEAIFTTLAVQRGIVPPTINYEEPDPECDLDYIPNEAREAADLRYGMSNSFGFGGHNASIVVARYDE